MKENLKIDNIDKRMTRMLNNSLRHTVSLQTQLVTKSEMSDQLTFTNTIDRRYVNVRNIIENQKQESKNHNSDFASYNPQLQN